MMRKFGPAFLLLFLLAGCIRIGREAPQKDFFTLEAVRQGEPAPQPRFGSLRLERLRVSAPFQGKPFVYRTRKLQYEEDFYSRFFASPGELITDETARWLRLSGLFPRVYTRPAPEEPETLMEGEISALYGDFRDPPGKAVMEIGLTLREGRENRILLSRQYRREIRLPDQTPEALATGWSEALTQILQALESDLIAVRTEK